MTYEVYISKPREEKWREVKGGEGVSWREGGGGERGEDIYFIAVWLASGRCGKHNGLTTVLYTLSITQALAQFQPISLS